MEDFLTEEMEEVLTGKIVRNNVWIKEKSPEPLILNMSNIQGVLCKKCRQTIQPLFSPNPPLKDLPFPATPKNITLNLK